MTVKLHQNQLQIVYWLKCLFRRQRFKTDIEMKRVLGDETRCAGERWGAAGIQGHAANCIRLQNDDEWNRGDKLFITPHFYILYVYFVFSALFLKCLNVRFLQGRLNSNSLCGLSTGFFLAALQKKHADLGERDDRRPRQPSMWTLSWHSLKALSLSRVLKLAKLISIPRRAAASLTRTGH